MAESQYPCAFRGIDRDEIISWQERPALRQIPEPINAHDTGNLPEPFPPLRQLVLKSQRIGRAGRRHHTGVVPELNKNTFKFA